MRDHHGKGTMTLIACLALAGALAVIFVQIRSRIKERDKRDRIDGIYDNILQDDLRNQ